MHIKVGDYVAAAFTLGAEQFLLAVTQDGTALRQERAWLESTAGTERRTRQLFNGKQAERALAGAAAANEADWGIVFRSDGSLAAFEAKQANARGMAIPGGADARVLAFTCFSPAGPAENKG